MSFLPMSREELSEHGEPILDFIIITGDAYVDHPSFGAAVIGRVLASQGYSVAVIAQPDWRSADDFKRFGKPRLAFLVNSGNIDSMVAHYTAAKKRRSSDAYSPGGKAGFRPDRAVIVYCNRIREAYGDPPIIIGGIEASTRRFAHYDYWSDSVRRSILVDSRANLLVYGMGENIIRRIAFLLDKGVPVRKIRDVRGTCFIEDGTFKPHFESEYCGDYNRIKTDKKAFAKAFLSQYQNQDHIHGKAVVESYDEKILVQNPPMMPLSRKELDEVYSLPYERNYHPSYERQGGIPAIEEVKFSITHNRGCFGNCNFCSLAFHQGRTVTSRSIDSVVKEAQIITAFPDFKGYIHDIGGPTANFRMQACEKQTKHGTCKGQSCLFPDVCKSMKVEHSEYIELLKRVEQLDGVKKVFIRSGIRYDYLIADKSERFFKKLVKDHVSGQLKVAPEHCSDRVLTLMGKPSFEKYEKFKKRFFELTKSINKEQYLVPYLMSSHPGSTLADAVELALYLKRNNLNPEQVQDFYPTPGTASTCMFYTGINPFDGKRVYTAKSYEEKKLQRALLQFSRRKNANDVRRALRKAGREELIGYGKDCLVGYDNKEKKQEKTRNNKKKIPKKRPESR